MRLCYEGLLDTEYDMTYAFRLNASAVSLSLLIAGCATPPAPPAQVERAVTQEHRTAPGALPDQQAFQAWLADFRVEAARKGISEPTLVASLDSITPTPRVVELDRKQPEFTQTFWKYLISAVSEARVRDGSARLKEDRDLLARLEAKYGVPGRVLVAFWGLETNYGRNIGSFKVPTALATLAFDGRRSTFFASPSWSRNGWR